MFEDMTYENILQGMLAKVTNDVDKREGSVIYDALAPAAYFLADQYYRLENYIDLLFADTSIGEYLDKCVQDVGMERLQATAAVRKVTTNGVIPIGSIWGIEGVNYTIEALIETNVYRAVCTEAGEIGNTYSGELSPVTGNSSVSVQLTDIITPGTDAETDEALRDRYMQQVKLQPASGNVADYLMWAREVSGVGNAKVFPIWNGNGTVKVLVVDSDYEVNEALEQPVYDHIEEVRNIGATVTVDSPAEKTISINAQVEKSAERSLEEIKADLTTVVKQYLKSLIMEYYQDESTGSYRVSIGMIGNLLFDVEGVEDYTSLTVNSGTGNIPIASTEIPVLGTINLTEISEG